MMQPGIQAKCSGFNQMFYGSTKSLGVPVTVRFWNQ
jgi:hypothetical protein